MGKAHDNNKFRSGNPGEGPAKDTTKAEIGAFSAGISTRATLVVWRCAPFIRPGCYFCTFYQPLLAPFVPSCNYQSRTQPRPSSGNRRSWARSIEPGHLWHAQTLLFGPIESSKQGPASSIYNTLRQIAASFGVALIITIFIDALLSFPSLIFVLALVATLGAGLINVAIALAVVRIPIYARIARGQTLQITSLDYIVAAEVSGTPTWRILLRHVLPNIFSPILVQATTSVSLAILEESVLGFLGLGAQPPTPEWGTMISAAQQYLRTDPWMMIGPALAIIIVLLSLNILGDAVRDHLDPRDTTALGKPI